MNELNRLEAFFFGILFSAVVAIIWILLVRPDVRFTYTQTDTYPVITEYGENVPIKVEIKGAEFGGNYNFGGNDDRKSFSEILDEAEDYFHRYYIFEQLGAADSCDIESVEILVNIRSDKMGARRK